MRIRGTLKDFLAVELLLIWLLRGAVFGFLFPLSSSSSVARLNYQNSFLSSHIFPLALVSLSMPWTTSGESIRAPTTKAKTRVGKNSTSTTTVAPKKRRKSKNLPQKQTSANNALMANIDFLTHLTNTKQEKSAEMDPLKCFPKALCGLSAESAAITRRRKNGLISDYIRLMKAVALNPSVMDKTLKKLKEREQPQDDAGKDSVESDEDRDDEDEDEEEDEEESEQRRPSFNKRTNKYGYGYDTISSAKAPNDGPAKKRTKRKEVIPKDSREFTKQYLQEKAHVERLIDDGFNNEDTESTNWWAYEKEKDPNLEELVDFSGTTLDSAESFYTFGGKRKPDPPIAPEYPHPPPQPIAPEEPTFLQSPPPAPPRPQPPSAPVVRIPQSSDSSGSASSIGSFFRNLFGFGGGSNGGAFSSDPFFQGFQRSMPDGTPTVVTVDKTKEILTTAIEIGETLRTPNQCNSLFNGCKYQYVELLHVIDDIRQSLAERGKDDFYSSFYTGNDENDSGTTADDTHSSYGYKSSLSETSQAETLSPDYAAAASAVTQKNGRRKKKKPTSRREKFSSMSRETSVEIGSDEPTLYGSGQQQFDFHQYNRHGHSLGFPHQQNQPSSSHNHRHQPSYQFEEMHIRQPKTLWGTILSWFGFR